MTNPLLQEFNTPFQSTPFDKIENKHFIPAMNEAISNAKEKLELIKKNQDEPNFENVIEQLERSDYTVGDIATIFFNLNSADTNDERQNIAKEVAPLLTEYSNDVILDEVLFSKVKAVYDKKDSLKLSVEQQTLLEKTYKAFIRNGALLKGDDKETLRELDKTLSKLSLEFGENVLAETNAYKMVISDEKELEGLPEGAIEAAAQMAKEKGDEGKWVITLDYPSYIPFMKYSKNRARRESLYKAFTSKGFQNNENDNQEIIKKIVNLRQERATLLGYNTHADFVLEERMAGNPKKVWDFLEDFLKYCKSAAEKEIEELKQFAEKLDGLKDVQVWDANYYFEKLKKEKFNIDDEMLKPYFQLESVVEGAFKVANILYGLTYKKVDNVPKYHSDVMTYEVLDKNQNHVGLFYADFFPRASKRGGAWMTSYKDQYVDSNNNVRPHVAIVCNFTKPTSSKPSLLTFHEVLTLFHEFGHSLHGTLANVNYKSLSGAHVYWDFVELPSQIMENWIFEKECLDLFAKHYETGEKIPEELVKKIRESSNFHEGRATLRQVSFGMLDMTWHSKDPKDVKSVGEYEKQVLEKTRLLPHVDSSNFSCSFSHIFQGGYSSGYYSYKWAEVLDADAFEKFKENGIFDKETAESFYNNILSKGGSEHPMTLYKRFRGREPKVDALLKRGGLLN